MNGTVHVDVSILQFLIGTFIPWVTALVMQRFADERVKSGVTTVVAIIVAIVQEAIVNGGNFDLVSLVSRFLTMLVVAYITHQFIWKPIGVTGDQGAIAKAFPSGVGRATYQKAA